MLKTLAASSWAGWHTRALFSSQQRHPLPHAGNGGSTTDLHNTCICFGCVLVLLTQPLKKTFGLHNHTALHRTTPSNQSWSFIGQRHTMWRVILSLPAYVIYLLSAVGVEIFSWKKKDFKTKGKGLLLPSTPASCDDLETCGKEKGVLEVNRGKVQSVIAWWLWQSSSQIWWISPKIKNIWETVACIVASRRIIPLIHYWNIAP